MGLILHPRYVEYEDQMALPQCLWKDLKTAPMSKLESNKIEPERTLGMMGISYAGFLAFNNCQVVSLLGTMPLDSRVRQAFPNIPHLPKDTAMSTGLPGVF